MKNMESVDLNIFRQLFQYHSRDGYTPRENFLTEAFAHVIASDKSVQVPIVKLLTSNAVTSAKLLSVKTQVHQAHDTIENVCIPDMIISGRGDDEVEFQIWVENKWDSPIRCDQIEKYVAHIAARSHKKSTVIIFFAFIAQSATDTKIAAHLLASKKGTSKSRMVATTWCDIYQYLEDKRDRAALTLQFITFMKENGLGELDLITPLSAKAFQEEPNAKSKGGRLGGKAGFRKNLLAMCNAALAKMRADGVRGMDDGECHDGWGRVAISTPEWKISVGVLYNEKDHGTLFMNPTRPLDIIVRIQANPVGIRREALEAARAGFESLRAELAEVGFESNPNDGLWRSNRHNIVLAHYKNGFPWNTGNVREQISEMVSIFKESLYILDKPQYRRQIAKLPSYD